MSFSPSTPSAGHSQSLSARRQPIAISVIDLQVTGLPRKKLSGCCVKRHTRRLPIWHDVRFGSKADMCSAKRHVRFTPNSNRESRHWERDEQVAERQLMENDLVMKFRMPPGDFP